MLQLGFVEANVQALGERLRIDTDRMRLRGRFDETDHRADGVLQVHHIPRGSLPAGKSQEVLSDPATAQNLLAGDAGALADLADVALPAGLAENPLHTSEH